MENFGGSFSRLRPAVSYREQNRDIVLGVLQGIVGWLESVLPWLERAVAITIAVWVFVFLPMLIIRKARQWAGVGFVYSSYLTGLSCWVFSLIVTYRTLGGFWLIFGLFFAGMGVFPLAVIGTMVRGLWGSLPDLVFAIASMLIPRFLGLYIVSRPKKAEQTRYAIAD